MPLRVFGERPASLVGRDRSRDAVYVHQLIFQVGPAALVQAARFLFDSRDQGFEERLEVLDHANGVWACSNHFQCTRVCPRGIKVTRSINLTKRKIRQDSQTPKAG